MSFTRARKQMQVWERYAEHVFRLGADTLPPRGYARAWDRYLKAYQRTQRAQQRNQRASEFLKTMTMIGPIHK